MTGIYYFTKLTKNHEYTHTHTHDVLTAIFFQVNHWLASCPLIFLFHLLPDCAFSWNRHKLVISSLYETVPLYFFERPFCLVPSTNVPLHPTVVIVTSNRSKPSQVIGSRTILSVLMTLTDLERRDARGPIFQWIPTCTLVPFDQQRSNSEW